MVDDARKNRKWERYCCLLPCRIIRATDSELVVTGRIINIGRGGLLIEADFDFKNGERVIVVVVQQDEIERFEIGTEVHGTVRWGQVDTCSLMGIFYIGVEFDELLPLRQAVSGLT